MGRHPRLLLGFVLALAAVLTILKVPVASSQGVTLVVEYRPGDLPTKDPDAALWKEAPALEVPLSAQVVTRPMLVDTRPKSITVRALRNVQQVAFLVEWADETKNDSMVRIQDFRDGAAIEFPVVNSQQPFYCMGQLGSNVNIWFWRADWQADLAARRDMETAYPNMYVDDYPFADPKAGLQAGPDTYTDPNYLPALVAGNDFASATHKSTVEDLNAGGFGSLTPQAYKDQNVEGYGVWADGKWRVIFSRNLNPNINDAYFTPAMMMSTAFAVWDGANNERDGQKSTSQWIALRVVDAPATPAPALTQGEAVAKPNDITGAVLVIFAPLGACFGIATLLAVGVAVAAVASRRAEKS